MDTAEDSTTFSPAAFVEHPSDVRRQLLNLAAMATSPATLVALEESIFAWIDWRYPDNPGSLLNREYRIGQRLKREIRQEFDEAHRHLAQQTIQLLAESRTISFDAHLRGIAAAHHDQQRALRNQQAMDHASAVARSTRAADAVLQADLARAAQEHRHLREMEAWRLGHTLTLQQLQADVEAARAVLDRPHALQLKLYDVMAELSHYQMALLDRANRNPALADRLRAMTAGLTAIMASVQSVINDLNGEGSNQPTPDQLRDQSVEILHLAMEQLRQWHEATSQETIT